MKIRLTVPALLVLVTLNVQPSMCLGQGTAFTYQGQLENNGGLANGTYNLRFTLFPAITGGTAVAGPVTNSAVTVSNGLFTVIVDFGPGVWNGQTNWLQIGVETNGVGPFTALSPRQELTPTPYAIFAEGANAAGLAGTIPMSSLSGTYGGPISLTNTGNSYSGSGAGLTGVNAATLGGLGSGAFWKTNGNAGADPANGAFLGTTDNNPLELHVNGARALRLEPTAGDTNHVGIVNVNHGSAANLVGSGIYGATISGGGAANYFGNATSNSVTADFGTVGGGSGNTASGSDNYYTTPVLGYSTVCGGVSNAATGTGSFVGGGGCGNGIFLGNTASGDGSAVVGGIANVASGGFYGFSFVGAGFGNTASGSYSTVAGGGNNTASDTEATVGGGDGNNASGFSSTIAGGYRNTASGQDSTVGGGSYNGALYYSATVAGGVSNIATSIGYGFPTVGGGSLNTATNDFATISGGANNIAGGEYSTVAGGYQNIANGYCAMVAGGVLNIAKGVDSFAAGAGAQARHDDSFVWSDGAVIPFSSTATNQFIVSAAAGVGIGTNNPQAQLQVTSTGGNSFPQAQLDQQNSSDSVRLRLTVGGDVAKRWDIAATQTNLAIFSGSIGANLIYLDNAGLYVRGTLVSSSDRNLKAGFEPVDSEAVLQSVAAMPITRWHYTNDASTPHLGPMAQDFYAAFNIGPDDKHIATVDEEGVALAAIQGLNHKVEAENEALRARNAELEARLDRLEKLVNSGKEGVK